MNGSSRLVKKLYRQRKNKKQIALETGLLENEVTRIIAGIKSANTKRKLKEKRSQAGIKADITKAKNWKKMIKSMLILDCTPKTDLMSEGFFLNELVKLINSKSKGPYIEKRFEPICTRDDFFDALEDAKEGIIHISAHGENSKDKGPIIQTASRAEIKVSELSNLWDPKSKIPRLVFLSACEVGQEELAHAFYENGIRYFIAPARKVWWYDAATFLTIFYRLLLVEKKKTPWMAFKATFNTANRLFPKFSGKWRYFDKDIEYFA